MQNIRYILADIRESMLPQNWRMHILTPVRDILSGGVSYYNDRDWYVEIYPNK